MNTLSELVAALSNDATHAAIVHNQLAAKAPVASPTFTATVSAITKAIVGLGHVDNTADAKKPVSAAAQRALDLKIGGRGMSTHLLKFTDTRDVAYSVIQDIANHRIVIGGSADLLQTACHRGCVFADSFT